ncbi:HAD-IIB family hydrolase [Peptostreptococcus sp.]
MEGKKNFRKKYFFFDIDGTIAIGMPRYIPESTKYALNKLKENGHFISVATGRMYTMTKPFCDEFGIKNMVTDGGFGTVLNGKVDIKPLDKQMMIDIVDVFEEKGIPWAICLADERVWHTKTKKFYDIMKKETQNYMDTVIDPNLDIRKVKDVFKGFACINLEEEAQLEALKNVTYTRYRPNYIIIEPDDKSLGIRKVMDLMGIEDQDVVVFGDNTNDIKMFRPEWTSIAMGNAVEELKKIADFVTKDADDGGIEHACRHFGWID